MSGELSESGQRLTDRLFGRVSRRSLIGTGSRFYERFGFADPLAPSGEGSGRGGFVFLSGASYYDERDAWLQDYEDLYARLGFFYSNRRAMARMARSGPAVRSRLVELALGDFSEPVLLGRHDLAPEEEGEESPAVARSPRHAAPQASKKRRFTMAPTLKDLLAELGPGVSNAILRELEAAVASSPETIPQEVVTQTVKRSLRKMSRPAARAVRHALASRAERRRDRDVTQLAVAGERSSEGAGPRRGLRRVIRQDIAGRRLKVRAAAGANSGGRLDAWRPAAPIAAAPVAPLADDYVTRWTPSARDASSMPAQVSAVRGAARALETPTFVLADYAGSDIEHDVSPTYAPAPTRRRSPSKHGAAARDVVRRVAGRLERAGQLVAAQDVSVAASSQTRTNDTESIRSEYATFADHPTAVPAQRATGTRAPARALRPSGTRAPSRRRSAPKGSGSGAGRYGRDFTIQNAVRRLSATSVLSAPQIAPSVTSLSSAIGSERRHRGASAHRSGRTSASGVWKRSLAPSPIASVSSEPSPFAMSVPMVVPTATMGELSDGLASSPSARVVRVKRAAKPQARPRLAASDVHPPATVADGPSASISAALRGDVRVRVDRGGRELLTAAPLVSPLDQPLRSSGAARLMMAPEGVVELQQGASSLYARPTPSSTATFDSVAASSEVTRRASRSVSPISEAWTLVRALASDPSDTSDIAAEQTSRRRTSVSRPALDTVPMPPTVRADPVTETARSRRDAEDYWTDVRVAPATRIARRIEQVEGPSVARSLLGERGVAPRPSASAKPRMSMVETDVAERAADQVVEAVVSRRIRRSAPAVSPNGSMAVEAMGTKAPVGRRRAAPLASNVTSEKSPRKASRGTLRGVAPVVRAASRRAMSKASRLALTSSPVSYVAPSIPDGHEDSSASESGRPSRSRVDRRAAVRSQGPLERSVSSAAEQTVGVARSPIASSSAVPSSVVASERSQSVVRESTDGVAPRILAEFSNAGPHTVLDEVVNTADAAADRPLRRVVRRLEAGQIGRETAVATAPLAHMDVIAPSVLPSIEQQRFSDTSSSEVAQDAPFSDSVPPARSVRSRTPYGGFTTSDVPALRPSLRMAARVVAAEQQAHAGPIASVPTLHLELALSDLFEGLGAETSERPRGLQRRMSRVIAQSAGPTPEHSDERIGTVYAPAAGREEQAPMFVHPLADGVEETRTVSDVASESVVSRSQRPASRRALRRIRRAQGKSPSRSLIQRPLPDVASDTPTVLASQRSERSRSASDRGVFARGYEPTATADQETEGAERLNVDLSVPEWVWAAAAEEGDWDSISPTRLAASRLDRKDDAWGWPEMEVVSSGALESGLEDAPARQERQVQQPVRAASGARIARGSERSRKRTKKDAIPPQRKVVARRSRPGARADRRASSKIRLDSRGQQLIAPRVVPNSDFEAQRALLQTTVDDSMLTTRLPDSETPQGSLPLGGGRGPGRAPERRLAGAESTETPRDNEVPRPRRRAVPDQQSGPSWRALERTVAPVGVLPAVQRVTAEETAMDGARPTPIAVYRTEDNRLMATPLAAQMSTVERRAGERLEDTATQPQGGVGQSVTAPTSVRARRNNRSQYQRGVLAPRQPETAEREPSVPTEETPEAYEEAWDEGYNTPVALAEARIERRRARRRLRSQSGNLLTALARAGRPEDVIEAILARTGEASSLGGLLPSSATRLVERIANVGEREEQRLETQAAQEARRAAEQVPTRGASRRRAVGRSQQVLRPTRVYRGSMSTPSASSAGHQGVGSSQVMKLAGKLMNLIHLAENQRKLSDAQGHVRMAEDTASAIAEGSGSAEGGGAKAVDMGVLQEAVLSNVMREIELIQARRDDPDGRNPWW